MDSATVRPKSSSVPGREESFIGRLDRELLEVAVLEVELAAGLERKGIGPMSFAGSAG